MRRTIVRLLALVLLGFAPQVHAFDENDIGSYQAIDSEGELTKKVFRVVRKPNGWRVEDRQDDGSWLDVTCQGGCPLQEASNEEIEAFFQARTPQNVTNHCLRNDAFAFCRIERTLKGRVEVGHALVVIVDGQAYPIRVRPLPKDGRPTHGAPEGESPQPMERI